EPGSSVTAGTRLEGGSVAINQDVRRGRPEGVGEGSSGRWQADVDAPQLRAPLAGGGVELCFSVDISGRGGERSVRCSEGSRQINVPCRPRGKIEIVPQGPGGTAEAVAHGLLRRYVAR